MCFADERITASVRLRKTLLLVWENAAARFPLNACSLTASLRRDSPQSSYERDERPAFFTSPRASLSRCRQRVASSVKRVAGGSVPSFQPRYSRLQTVTKIVQCLHFYPPVDLTNR